MHLFYKYEETYESVHPSYSENSLTFRFMAILRLLYVVLITKQARVRINLA